MKKIKRLISVIAGISMLAMMFTGCPSPNSDTPDKPISGPEAEPTSVSQDFTQPDLKLDANKPHSSWEFVTYGMNEFAGKDVVIVLSCDVAYKNNTSDTVTFKWQINDSSTYPEIVTFDVKPGEGTLHVSGKNGAREASKEFIPIKNGNLLYLSTNNATYDITMDITNIKYTVTYGSTGDEPAPEPAIKYPTDIFKVGEKGSCGIKIGDKALIPFSSAIQFDAPASNIEYLEDGSVSWIATAAGGGGGGVAFYFDENQSVLNTKNYDSVDIELTYSPITGAWAKDAQDPGFCLRLLTYDSTGVFGGAVDAEYFDSSAAYGDLKKNVNLKDIPAKVEDAADFDGIKGFVIKFNDYQRGNTDGDQVKVQLKKITFNRKDGAPADAAFDDGLKPEQRGKVTSVEYPTKDYAEIASKDGAISAAKKALAKAEKIEDADEKAAAIKKANEDLATAEAIVLSDAATKGYKKHAWVYTPAGYDPADKETKYPVFVLLHGHGQNENTWGLSDKGDGGKIKGYMDRGMANGSVKKFILICVTGIASKNWGPNGAGTDMDGFNAFSPELRDDILPWVYANYNCIEDRDHTALAGLSMGGGQTFNNGLKDNLDKISYFGAFSAAVFTDAATYKADVEANWKDNPELKVHYLYMICGTADYLVYNSFPDFVNAFNAEAWPTRIEKFSETTVEGGTHDFPVWFRGFNEFISYIFK